MGCQRSYFMFTILSKKKQKNWGSKIKRIENELEDIDIKFLKIKKSRSFQFPLPATNKQKILKPIFTMIFLVTETCPFAHEEIRDSHRKT